MLKVIIAEDDPSMRLVLKRVIMEISGVEIIGESETGKQLVQMTKELKPDVVFVDVDMPEMNGVEAAKVIFDINPKIFIIFATAYDNYTHEAFQVYAFDYLVKPFELERIKQTMNRIIELKAERDNPNIVNQIQPQAKSFHGQKFMIMSNESYSLVNIHDIVLITREEQKTVIYTNQGAIFSTYENLKQIEKRITTDKLFRCHKGYIINVDFVMEITPWGNKTYLIKMANIKENALITMEKLKEFREKYCF